MGKMRMTEILANQLMDNLACLWISANNALIQDRNGEPTLTVSDTEEMKSWAKDTFLMLTEYWEEETGKEWEVVKE